MSLTSYQTAPPCGKRMRVIDLGRVCQARRLPSGVFRLSWADMRKRWVFWTVFGCAAYVLLVFLAHRAMPIGQVALLDAREQQVMAQHMANGTLPAEPFYRAPLWAGILSIFYRLGMNDEGVLLAGQVLNLILHALAAWAVAGTAMNLWRNKKIAIIAGALYALYPVALYLGVDLLDTTLAQALLCGGLYFFTRHITREKDKAWHALIMAVLFALAFFTRPQLAVVGFGALAILLWMTPQEKRRATRGIWGGTFVFLAILSTFGLMEWRRTGVFYLLPTQGSYNLWSANRPGATGEYYAQQVELTELKDGENPTRAEARELYKRETQTQGEPSDAVVNRYWRARLAQHAGEHSVEFTALYAKKLYSLLDNHEAYNNKTYAFQKNENAALRWNPLGFVVISVMAILVFLFVRPLPRALRPVILLGIIYWLAAGLFYTSDRFRLPLVPLVIAIAAAAPAALACIRTQWRARTRKKLLGRLSLAIAWVVAFSLPLWDVGMTDTTPADKLLMGQAALKTGNDAQALALWQDIPVAQMNQAQIENLVLARYNLLLKGERPASAKEFKELKELGMRCVRPSIHVRYVLGLCEWQIEGKRGIWHKMVEENESLDALAALVVTGPMTKREVEFLFSLQKRQEVPLLLAQASLGDTRARKALNDKMGEEQAAHTLQAWRKLFDRQDESALNKGDAH